LAPNKHLWVKLMALPFRGPCVKWQLIKQIGINGNVSRRLTRELGIMVPNGGIIQGRQ